MDSQVEHLEGIMEVDNEEVDNVPPQVDLLSDQTKKKVAAAKSYIEQHYRNKRIEFQERKARFDVSP